jgi:hypothetical protein
MTRFLTYLGMSVQQFAATPIVFGMVAGGVVAGSPAHNRTAGAERAASAHVAGAEWFEGSGVPSHAGGVYWFTAGGLPCFGGCDGGGEASVCGCSIGFDVAHLS